MAERCEVNATVLNALCAGPHAIVSPVTAYSIRRETNRPILLLTGVVMLTTLAASASNPVAVHILRSTPGIAASAGVAKVFVLTQSMVITPLGTVAFLLAMTVVVWALAQLADVDLVFRQSASVVFIAGVVNALKQAFVAVVLYARWWFRPSTLSNEITTGLDGFIAPERAATFPFSILGESGLFEIWFLALVAVGLEHSAGLRRRTALAISGFSGVILVSAKVALAALPPT